MASLNHVCMWDNNKWKRITAEEAAELHPGGTVKARSGLFMCELCGQYVTLTDGPVRERYFKHSRGEQDKNCEERTFPSQADVAVLKRQPSEIYDLPIQIRLSQNNSFELYIGFFHTPEKQFIKDLIIQIFPRSPDLTPLIYAGERMNEDGITYLSVGHVPCKEYEIKADKSGKKFPFWPEKIQGISSKGNLFDALSGKKLEENSDVTVGTSYFLLVGNRINTGYESIRIKEKFRTVSSGKYWYVYEIVAEAYTEESAKFFLKYHYRLTDKPVSFCPVWPIYVEDPYVIKFDGEHVVIRVDGDAETRTFPSASGWNEPCGNEEESKIWSISCNSRQQMIYARRNGFNKKALQYLYFWREPLTQTTDIQTAEVTDLQDNIVTQGISDHLPQARCLRVTLPYDGTVIIKNKSCILGKRQIHANVSSLIDDIGWNYRIQVYVGLDKVWEISYERKENCPDEGEEDGFLYRLQILQGKRIHVPYSARNMVVCLQKYPKIQKWLYRKIQDGWICENAYRELQSFVLNKGKLSKETGDKR